MCACIIRLFGLVLSLFCFYVSCVPKSKTSPITLFPEPFWLLSPASYIFPPVLRINKAWLHLQGHVPAGHWALPSWPEPSFEPHLEISLLAWPWPCWDPSSSASFPCLCPKCRFSFLCLSMPYTFCKNRSGCPTTTTTWPSWNYLPA